MTGKEAVNIAKTEFAPDVEYSPMELGECMDWLDTLKSWIEHVRQFAYREAQHGRPPTGYKLVKKRMHRKWRDVGTLEDFFKQAFRVPINQLYDQKLKSPTQVEKLLDKKGVELLETEITCITDGTTLVPSFDAREEVESAEEDFEMFT